MIDCVVVGAGVFGSWTALRLRESGRSVVLVDAFGPGNPKSSSGGASRVIRMGYGADEIYTRWAMRSLTAWKELFERAGRRDLFQHTGVLWTARSGHAYGEGTIGTFRKLGVEHEALSAAEVRRRYPGLRFDQEVIGIFEPESGALLANRAVQAVTGEAARAGVEVVQAAVVPPDAAVVPPDAAVVPPDAAVVPPDAAVVPPDAAVVPPDAAVVPPDEGTRLERIATEGGRSIEAANFIFACGPWLPKLFPQAVGRRIRVTRQAIFYFDWYFDGPGIEMPVWIDFTDPRGGYAIPPLAGKGFKLALDQHGAQFDPDSGSRAVTEEETAAARAFLAERFPALRDAPVTESEVCQYESTSSGDFLIDRHPAMPNVWLVGGGSGHGFKHGPAVGEYVTGLMDGVDGDPRFSWRSKLETAARSVY